MRSPLSQGPRLPVLLSLVLVAGTAGVVPASGALPPSGEAALVAVWQPRQLDFSYTGITTLYTCDGLEQKVRSILLHLGARKDAHVSADGCMGAFGRPSNFAHVTGEFSALALAGDPAAVGAIRAGWNTLELRPMRPMNMDAGDCELIEHMRGLIEKDFTLRKATIRATCIPHQVSSASYGVQGEVLKALVP